MGHTQNETRQQERRRRGAFGRVVEVWRYRIITLILLAIPASLLDNMLRLLIRSNGTAITTANLGQLLNWRTPLLALLGLAVILLFIVFEILGQIYLCHDILQGKDGGVFREIGRGFRAIPRFFSPKGIGVALFIAIAVPLCGFGFSISVTESFYIPNFITSVIFSNTLFTVGYCVIVLALIYAALRWIFTVHAMLLDDMKAGEALKRSSGIMRRHWKDFLRRFAVIALYSAAICAASYLICKILPNHFIHQAGERLPVGHVVDLTVPGAVLSELDGSVLAYRVAAALAFFLGNYVHAIVTVFLASNMMLQLTKLYFIYTERPLTETRVPSRRRLLFLTGGFVALPAALVLLSCFLGMFFDQIPLFRRDLAPEIVAHRTGGTLASENSLEGIDLSVELGVFGIETDIQRTRDGEYVINHDATFARLTGVDKAPEELTLAEVKELRIRDTTGSGTLLEVPTMDELLDRCKDRTVAFVELKGASVDEKMADDAVAALRARNMTDQAVLISLDYSVLQYIERTYPEINTGVLIFASIGDAAGMVCDTVIMEEEMSTPARIQSLHAAGKAAGVWTVNTEDGLRHFMDADVDYIITDEVDLAVRIRSELAGRSDAELMRSRLENML